MTYGELLEKLYVLGRFKLDQEVTVFVGEGYHPVTELGVAVDERTLDEDHLVLVAGDVLIAEREE